ncbi:MAG: hypothetical protein O6920_03835 [Chloroflexi bacterium]|nr:hypothetical protein [Chloroflexota bacterium]
MSKLLDRLDHITRGAPNALGFTAAASRETIPQMALLARVTTPRQSDISALADAKVDAFILSDEGKSPKQTVKPLKDRIWGAMVDRLGREQMEAYKAAESDFMVFGIDGTLADTLEEGEAARILRIPPNLEEPILRGLEDLPIDIVLLQRPGVSEPLTLTHLLAISNVRTAMSRYLLLEWDGELTARDLEHLRDIGVDGIVLDTTEVGADTFKSVRQRIDAMPKRKPRGEPKPAAVLPRFGGLPVTDHHHEEDEEEDEDEM